MGKTSSRASSSGSSIHSMVNKKSLHAAMSSLKKNTAFKKKHKKTRRSIEKLFNTLRKQSSDSLQALDDNSVIVLDDSSSIKAHLAADSSSNVGKVEDTVICLNDDLDDTMGTPKRGSKVHCSTPLNKQTSLNLDLSDVSRNSAKEILDLTKEVNEDSYITVDLTTESTNVSKEPVTVIDLENVSDNSKFVSLSNSSLSMSGDSDITVLNKSKYNKKNKQMKKFADGISKMNSSDKGRLLELITQQIFNGCAVPNSSNANLIKIKERCTRSTETAEDTYIKEVILGQQSSRNSIGSNIYNPQTQIKTKSGLRMVVVDGSNVAMQHTKGRIFSVLGLKICIEYFVKRGHIVKAFVPRFRCKAGKSSDPRQLDALERAGLVIYTPSREVQGRCIASYDDRYIVQCAAEFDGVIVTQDNYRDLLGENPRWRTVIETRLLPFTWVNDMIMFPRDPLGRNGPTLEAFLRHPM